jgi:type IX secretion system substrate protein
MALMLLVFYDLNTSAQLAITPGAQFSIFSDTKLTLQNIDLVNNGNFLVATTSPISFTGDASSFIEGDQTVRFFKVQINKTGDQSVILRKTISVGNSIFFTSGFLNLNGFNVDLETTGSIQGENNNSRFTGANGGQILLVTNLAAPSNANPGNLGIVITSDKNLGQVTIKRGHQSQVGQGLASSILRYYEVLPANNVNLNAVVRFNYLDAELNGFNGNSLSFFKSDDAVNWTDIGFSSRDTIQNFVEKNVVSSFSRFTLSTSNIPLPVNFVSFNVNCEGERVRITWQTAQEQNSSRFDVERSGDGTHWSVIGSLPAAGNTSSVTSYSFSDNNPPLNAQYRTAEYDVTGAPQYTTIIKSSCNVTELLKAWPNPIQDKLFINITTASESQATIKVFDSRGALIKVQRTNVLPGNNLLNVDMKLLPGGNYLLTAEWSGGRMKKSTLVVKH